MRYPRRFAVYVEALPPFQPVFGTQPPLDSKHLPPREKLNNFEISLKMLLDTPDDKMFVWKIQKWSLNLVQIVNDIMKQYRGLVTTKDTAVNQHVQYRRLVHIWRHVLHQIQTILLCYVDTKLKIQQAWVCQAFPEEVRKGREVCQDLIDRIQSALISTDRKFK